MQMPEIIPSLPHRISAFWVGGVSLIAVGILILLDWFLKTGWLSAISIPMVVLLLLGWSLREKRFGWVIPSALALGLAGGGAVALLRPGIIDIYARVGTLLIGFSFGWLLIFVFARWLIGKFAFWALIPGIVIGATGICLVFSARSLLDFVLNIGIGLGAAFLLWGISQRLFGLIIPGCILITAAPGISLAWNGNNPGNGLTQTGIMLVWFALGWGLITVCSRVITDKFVWWPLIPGGILAMVGWGLYLGGDPKNASSFIGNTGAIGLIIFGLYLLLMRSGIRK